MIKDIFQGIKLSMLEKQIVQYIDNNPECIMSYNAKQLSEHCYVSPSTINRFIKKLGFSGYNEFQLTYTKMFTLEKNISSKEIIQQNPTTDAINLLPQIYEHIYQDTKQLIDKNTFVRIVNYVLEAKQLDFYANDVNYSEIQAVCLKLNNLGFRAQAYNTISQQYLKTVHNKDVFAFVISHSGNNNTMIDAAKILKTNHIRFVAITGKNDQTLAKLANECLYLSSYDKYFDILPYSVSLHYLLDILVLLLSQRKKD